MYLYQYVRGFDQSELHRRLAGTAYVYIRFDLPRPPTQQAISYIWRNRLSLADRRTIKATAGEIRDIAADRGIVSSDEPRLRPDEVDAAEITDNQIVDAVEAARDRATNAIFEDLAFFDRQDYLNIADLAGLAVGSRSTCKYPSLSWRNSANSTRRSRTANIYNSVPGV